MDNQNNLNPQPKPVPTPDPLQPQVAPASPAPAVPEQQVPVPESVTPSVPVAPAPVAVAPVVAPAPAVPPQPTVSVSAQPVQKKQNLLWLWVVVGVLVFFTIVVALVLFVSKQSADQAARDYTKAATAYVKDIHDKVNTSPTASDAKKDLDESLKHKPELQVVFLSSLSSDYATAIALQKSVDGNVKEFSVGITELAGLDAYIDQNQKNYTKLSTSIATVNSNPSKTAAVKAMEDILVILKSVESSTGSAVFPAELSGPKDELVAAYKAEVIAWELVIKAAKNSDSSAYSWALDEFQAAADRETAAFDEVNQFYYNLSTKRQDLLEKLDSFQKYLA